MKKFLLLASLICSSALFAQVADTTKVTEPESPVADTAKVTADTTASVIPATEPVDEPVESAEVTATDTTAANADTAAAQTDTTASVIPATEPESPVADTTAAIADTAAADTAKVAAPAPDTVKVAEPAEATMACTEAAAAPIADSVRKWTHYIGMGATVPVAQYKVDHKKTDLVNYGVALSYMGVNRSGFTTRLSVAAGGSVTDNIQFDGSDDWQIGSFGSAEIGLGVSFVNSKSLTLALLAVAGFEYAIFETEEKEFYHAELGQVERSFQETLGALTLGGDIVLRIGLSDHVGLWAAVGGRWVAVTVAESAVRYNKDDYTRAEGYVDDGSGVYSIVPTLGVMWNF
jgi:hypothetical protein